MKTFKTAKGTELQISNLRGKDYLEVKYRLLWFREEKPNWTIETNFTECSQEESTCRAVIKDETNRIIATGHKHETKKGFADFREKAETGAIGRALAHVGYGTQFAPELSEGDRIVDSPVEHYSPTNKEIHKMGESSYEPESRGTIEGSDLVDFDSFMGAADVSEYEIQVGKKYKGMRLKEVPKKELQNYADWLTNDAQQKQQSLSSKAREFIEKVNQYLQ